MCQLFVPAWTNETSLLKLEASENNNNAQNLSFRGTPRLPIVRSDLLWAERSGDQIPMGARFSAHLHAGPRAHASSYKMGTASLFRV